MLRQRKGRETDGDGRRRRRRRAKLWGVNAAASIQPASRPGDQSGSQSASTETDSETESVSSQSVYGCLSVSDAAALLQCQSVSLSLSLSLPSTFFLFIIHPSSQIHPPVLFFSSPSLFTFPHSHPFTFYPTSSSSRRLSFFPPKFPSSISMSVLHSPSLSPLICSHQKFLTYFSYSVPVVLPVPDKILVSSPHLICP